MVLLSFLLVLAAAVTLVIGLLNGGLGLIYLSIACSLGAGIVLALAVVRSRPRAVPALGGPAPIPGGWGDDEPTAVQSSAVRRRDAEPAPAPAYDDATFPIAGYDGLKVTDILPLLPELEHDELEQVRAHETSGKNRSRILGRIDMLTTEAEWEAPEADEDEWEPETAPVAPRAARATSTATARRSAPTVVDDFDEFDDEGGDDDDFDDADFDDDDDFDADVFPIADYDELKVGEIMPLLPELDEDELAMVREREGRGQARGMILNRIDRLTGGSGAAAPAKAPARKTTARKTAATKRPSAAKKTTATKRTGAAKKTTATKRPSAAKKTAATKRPSAAKKTAAKKSTRSTAKKTVAKRR